MLKQAWKSKDSTYDIHYYLFYGHPPGLSGKELAYVYTISKGH